MDKEKDPMSGIMDLMKVNKYFCPHGLINRFL
jgi:hypothetical protein